MFKKSLTGFMVTMAFVIAPTFSQAADRGEIARSTFPAPTEEPTDRSLWKPTFGLTAGSVDPEGAYRPAAEYGINFGYQPYAPIGFGVSLSGSKTDNDVGTKLDRTTALITSSYNLGGEIPVIRYSYLGAGIGAVFESDETKSAFAPVIVGFDIPLKQAAKDYISLGLDAKYLIVNGSNPDVLAMNGVVKYWF